MVHVLVPWCHGACFIDVGGNISWLRETIKRICREYGGNAPASWFWLYVVAKGVHGICGRKRRRRPEHRWLQELGGEISRAYAGRFRCVNVSKQKAGIRVKLCVLSAGGLLERCIGLIVHGHI
jgi:hypothetical protein